jgi:hypothetical protein
MIFIIVLILISEMSVPSRFYVNAILERSSINKPPINRINPQSGKGENGYRLLTPSECATTIDKWQKKLGIMNKIEQIETFEILRVMEKFSLKMPGREPHRKYFLEF